MIFSFRGNRRRSFIKAFLLLLLFGGLAVEPVTARLQTGPDRVVIQPRRVVLDRGNLAKDFPERRKAVLRLPVISGLSNPAVLRKVRATLQLKNIFETSLEEYRQDTWLSEFDYKVNYNQNHILDITFTQSGMGAYPDTHTKHFIINLQNGNVVKAADVFKPDAIETLVQMVDRKLQDEVKTIIKEGVETDTELDADQKQSLNEQLGQLKFTAENLDEFSVSATGITFLYDAGFPHVIQALQPEGRYFFSYAELKPFIKSEGLLGKLIR